MNKDLRMALIACGYTEAEHWWKKPFGSGAIVFGSKPYGWLKENEIMFLGWNGLDKLCIDDSATVDITEGFDSICYQIKEFEGYSVNGARYFQTGYHMLNKVFNNDIPIAERMRLE